MSGITGIAVECANGLVCDDSATSAHAADQMGRCIDIVPGELGAGCGYGVSGVPLECKAGFECADDGGAKPDQLGVCVRAKR